jgi:iron complex transport system ATP-binding protein
MADPILEIEHVSFRAGAHTILKDVCWTVCRGEHWALLGPNGSGKTTLLRIAAGLLWPNAGGRVLRLGQRLIDLRLLRRSIGWVTQSMIPEVPGDERALDTVVSGRLAQLGLKRFHDYSPADADFDAAHDLMRLLRITQLAAKPFGVLSQGEKQAVLVARARMADPLLIVLDEACAGMDPGVRERFLVSLDELLAQPNSPASIFVTHHVEELVPSMSRTLILDGGRVQIQGLTAEVILPHQLETLYGVHVADIYRYAGRYWPIFGVPLDGHRGASGG